jgi:hypothetical protein
MNKMEIKKIPILMKNNIKNILKGRIILDSIFIRYSKNINKNFTNFANELNLFLDYLLKQGFINNKAELYFIISDSCLLFNLYTNLNILPINIYNNNHKSKILKSIENYSESLFNSIINDLIPFSCYQIKNISKLDEILSRYYNIFIYLMKFIKGNTKSIDHHFNKIYLLRIIFSTIFFLIYIYKIFLKYNKICSLFILLQQIINEYNDLTLIKNEKIVELITTLNKKMIKILKVIKEQLKTKKMMVLETGLIYYIHFMNYSINKELLNILRNNNNIKNISYINLIKLNTFRDFNYIEKCEFIIDLENKIESDINGFEYYIKKYTKEMLNSFLSYEIYIELKDVFINKKNINYINEDKDNYKIIKFEKVFESKEKNKFFMKFNKFEKIFKIRETIIKYLPILSNNFKYEKNKEINNFSDKSLPYSSNISKKKYSNN